MAGELERLHELLRQAENCVRGWRGDALFVAETLYTMHDLLDEMILEEDSSGYVPTEKGLRALQESSSSQGGDGPQLPSKHGHRHRDDDHN